MLKIPVMKVQTIPGASYALTSTKACTITALRDNGSSITVLNATSAGQYLFVAPTDTVTISDNDALVTQTFKSAAPGLSAQGGAPDNFYMTIDSDGTRRSHNNDKLVIGGDICSIVEKTAWNDETPDITIEDAPFSNLIQAPCMFSGSNIKHFSTPVPILEEAYGMFYYCSKLTSCTSNFPALKKGSSMFFACDALKHFTADFPALTDGDSMFSGCSSLVNLTTDLSALENGRYMFYGCNALTSVTTDFAALENGENMFCRCNLDAAAINSILTGLPKWTDGKTHAIAFLYCPGAEAADKSIGTAKGWTVQV